MIVVTLTDCPPALRGDLSKWLMEINTGVYVGQVSARVRDKLWERITQNIRNGRATMVYEAPNEQKMEFRIHNTSWQIVDRDGIKLVRRPMPRLQAQIPAGERPEGTGTSNAARYRKINRIAAARAAAAAAPAKALRKGCFADCSVVDIETTGLDSQADSIIEIAALRVRGLQVVERFNVLVAPGRPLPGTIARLTGLSDDVLTQQGLALGEALERFRQFIGADVLLIHNAAFDTAFLKRDMALHGLPPMNNRVLDTCMLARKAFLKVPDYKLSTLAAHFGVEQPVQHRALADCQTAFEVYKRIAQTE